MALAILFLFFVLAVFMPKSRILYCVMVVYMWLLFALNTEAPDSPVYEWVYNDNIPGAFEPLFTAIMDICRMLDMPFIGFRMVLATLLLIFLNLTYKKIEQYKALALAMYMISLFPGQVSTIRAALACAILMYAMSVFIDNPKQNSNKYCILLFIATLIHYSSILFIVYFLARRETTKNTILYYLIIAVLGILIVQHTDILIDVVSRFTNREKILTWLSQGPNKEGYPNLTGFTAEMIILFGNIFFTKKSKSIVFRYDMTVGKRRIAKTIADLNVITILFIPLLSLNDTYMRLLYVMHGINIVLYTMTAFVLQEYRGVKLKEHQVRVMAVKTRFSLYVLVIPLWSFLIIMYQNLPYIGTINSVMVFLSRNIIFQ